MVTEGVRTYIIAGHYDGARGTLSVGYGSQIIKRLLVIGQPAFEQGGWGKLSEATWDKV